MCSLYLIITARSLFNTIWEISRLTHPSALPQGVFALLESLPSSEKGSIIEHIVAVRIEGPVAPLAWLLVISRHLDEALIQRQVVAD